MLVAPDDTYILIVQQNKERQKDEKTSEDEQDGVATNNIQI